MPNWLRFLLLGVAFGFIPALWLAVVIAEKVGRWWAWSYPGAWLRCRLCRSHRTTAGARAPDRAPAVHQDRR